MPCGMDAANNGKKRSARVGAAAECFWLLTPAVTRDNTRTAARIVRPGGPIVAERPEKRPNSPRGRKFCIFSHKIIEPTFLLIIIALIETLPTGKGRLERLFLSHQGAATALNFWSLR